MGMAFLGEYTKLGELGKGGFAKVYKVRHNNLGYIRAIRILKETITSENSSDYQKFIRECKVLLRLGNGNHRNIVHIYQPRLLDNQALVEMDFIDGKDISQYLKDNDNFLPIEEVLRMIVEISDALAYCHEDIYKFCIDPDKDNLKNDPVDGSKWLIDEATKKRLIDKYKVIHNDIHSRNIMRREDGSFVLFDFGLAINGLDDVRNSSRHENGAVEFKAPEKWDDEKILTEQSDIYSFGVVMYEYLAGRVPYVCQGNSFNDHKKLYETIKSSTSIPSMVDIRRTFYEKKYVGETYENDIPLWLEETILRCLSVDPQKRFHNGKELHEHIVKNIEADNNSRVSDQSLIKEIQSLKREKRVALSQLESLNNLNSKLEGEKQEALSRIDDLSKQRSVLENNISELNGKNSVLEVNIKFLKKKQLIHLILCSILGVLVIIMGIFYHNNNNGKTSNPPFINNADSRLLDSISVLKKQVSLDLIEVGELNDKLETANTTIVDLQKEIENVKKERDILRRKINE